MNIIEVQDILQKLTNTKVSQSEIARALEKVEAILMQRLKEVQS